MKFSKKTVFFIISGGIFIVLLVIGAFLIGKNNSKSSLSENKISDNELPNKPNYPPHAKQLIGNF